MNDLQYIDTLENGNSLLLFPHGGELFYFEAIDWETIRLYMVDTVGGKEKEHDETTKFEGLPAPVRRAIITSQYEMRSTKTTLEGAMHG